jgi:Baseplate J-like protein
MATPPTVVEIGKRPIIDYVTKDYDGFRQAMLDQIALLLPHWTDRSESDFGVVLIELFAYVADILSYYQDRVANEAYLATATQRRSVAELLRLIDYQIDPGLAASAFVHVDVSADVSVAGANLPYRLKTAGTPGQPDRVFEITLPFTAYLRNSGIELSAASLPAGSAAIAIASADHALAPGHRVYFEEQTTGPGGAPKIRRSPLLQVVEVKAIDLTTDSVSWLPPLPEGFDPTKTKLRGNNFVATHGQTLNDEPVYVGNGAPRQAMTLTRAPVTHLLSKGKLARRRSLPELEVRVDGVRWEQVATFFDSGPFDPHYVVTIDENDKLTVHFGTGQRGAVVPPGAEVKAVYRVGLGRGGNVGADTLTVAVTSAPGVKAITNPFNAVGGADRETIEEAKISGPASVVSQDRAVTLQDHELLSKAFPGVGKAKARVGLRGGYKVVQVYVAPEDAETLPPPLPSEDLKLGLKAELESRMPVNRMAGVDVLDPLYLPIDIAVDVHAKADALASKVRDDVRAVLDDYLSFANQDFGRAVRIGEIFSALYPVPGVAYVQLRRVAVTGTPAAVEPGGCDLHDVPVAENQLPHRGVLTVNVFGGVS